MNDVRNDINFRYSHWRKLHSSFRRTCFEILGLKVSTWPFLFGLQTSWASEPRTLISSVSSWFFFCQVWSIREEQAFLREVPGRVSRPEAYWVWARYLGYTWQSFHAGVVWETRFTFTWSRHQQTQEQNRRKSWNYPKSKSHPFPHLVKFTSVTFKCWLFFVFILCFDL